MEDVAEKGEGNRMHAIDTRFTPRINGFDSHSIGITRPFLGCDLGLKKRDDRWVPPVSEGERGVRAAGWAAVLLAGPGWLAPVWAPGAAQLAAALPFSLFLFFCSNFFFFCFLFF
jgi:hypothetical protein